MPFVVLLVLALVCVQSQWPEPPGWLSPLGATAVTWLGVLLTFVSATWESRQLHAQLVGQAQQPSALWQRFLRYRRWHLLALVVVYLGAVYFLGWGATVQHWAESNVVLRIATDLLILAPFIVGLLLAWLRYYEVERTIHGGASAEPFPTLRKYLLLQARHSLLLALPPLLLLLVQQLVFGLYPSLREDEQVLPLLAGGLLGGLFVGMPLVLRVFLGLRPLPAGRLRDRLLLLAAQLRLHCNDILVWDTHHTTATALLVGPLPLLRYVVLTDRLIADLSHEEIAAVFAHEIGHIKHRHMLLYFAFLGGSMTGLTLLANALLATHWLSWLEQALPWRGFWAFAPAVLLLSVLAAYVVLVFGFLSRRCERQADLFACQMVSYPAFITALENVALLNGQSRERPGWLASWQHASIAERVTFLQRAQLDPRLERWGHRHAGMVQWGMLLGLAALLLVLFWVLGPSAWWDMLRKV